jgi:hypothetical protein
MALESVSGRILEAWLISAGVRGSDSFLCPYRPGLDMCFLVCQAI